MIYNEINKLNAIELKSLDEEIIGLLNSHFSLINTDLTNLLLKNSKRLRSNLIFLFSKSLNIITDKKIIKLAAAIELLHSATLIHDDIIDEAQVRRGFPTLNIKYGSKTAVITGDLVLTLAIEELLSLENPKVLKIISSCVSTLCLGELNQTFSKGKVANINEYTEKSMAKTSSLFEAALHSFSVLTNSDEKSLISFARFFGIAFQIKDDLKNLLNEDNLKFATSDFDCGVYTAPVIFYRDKFQNITNFKEDWKNDKNLQNELISLTTTLIKKYSDKALENISFIKDNQVKKLIEQLCRQLWEYN